MDPLLVLLIVLMGHFSPAVVVSLRRPSLFIKRSLGADKFGLFRPVSKLTEKTGDRQPLGRELLRLLRMKESFACNATSRTGF